ncbi:hypothetical protein BVG16_20315 [Paenibacillus selenitireducens]|uniref:DUF11 domain-containing protein n=1 Tax=Paenibacillus selenitireducens TaxID=1324314 RepID=A0A1T2X724_9BACL|nr:hypothetical protein [Paenibacillus selenitireducens]OPA75679.1 hypothetical protein BVG16_20315 [Paenibacillus selenitireducens]
MGRSKKLIMILTLSMVVSQLGASVSFAAQAVTKQSPATTNTANKATTSATLSSIKSINISPKSSVKLTDINILTQDNENILTYTLTYTNMDQKDISLIDYWSKVKTKSGTVYSSNILAKDKEKKRVSAQSSLTITYYAKIGKVSKVSDLIIGLVKWDFSMSNYEKQLGQYVIPGTVTVETLPGNSKTIRANDIPIKTKVATSSIYTTKDYSYISIGLNFLNQGYKVLEDPKFKFVVKSAEGFNYPVELDTSSVDYKVQPQGNKTLNLMTRIPVSIKTDKLQLQIIQDDETSKLTLPVATYQLAQMKKENIEGSQDDVRTINAGNTQLNVQLRSSWVTSGKDNNEITATLEFENSGNQAITLPKYNFAFITRDGYSYPITTKALENVTIDPLGKKTIRLSTEIPALLNTEGMQIAINQPKNTTPENTTPKDNIDYPIAIFKLPALSVNENTIGKEYTVQTAANSTLGVKLSSVQRLPWIDGDIISAKISIRNYRFDSVELPKLDGLMKFDNIKATDGTKLVQTNTTVLLGANQTLDTYIVTKVPYGMDFRQLQVYLMEKLSEENSSEIIQISNNGSMSELPVIKNGDSNEFTTQGRRALVKVRKTKLYPGSSSNIIYSEVEMKNLETRQTDLSQLTGYYKSKDGQYFKASVTQVENATSPAGKNLVTFWAKVPRGLDTSSMQLIVGESVTDNKFTPIKGVATGYVNAAAYELVQSSNEYKSSLSNIELFPYKLSVTNMVAYASGASISINMNYNLERDSDYEMGTYEHKLLVEIVDSTGRTSERELTLENDLKLGNGKSTTLSFDGSDTDRKTNNYFTIVLYDQFQGQKIKLASQAYFFTNNKND